MGGLLLVVLGLVGVPALMLLMAGGLAWMERRLPPTVTLTDWDDVER